MAFLLNKTYIIHTLYPKLLPNVEFFGVKCTISVPRGGANKDWQTTMEMVGKTVADAIKELQEIPIEELVPNRVKKFLSMTRDVEIFQLDHTPEEKQV